MTKPQKKPLVPALRFPEFHNAGMWDENAFGGVATFFNGRAYKQEELLDTGKYRVLRVGNFFSNNEWYYSDLELEDNKYCENGDLLYAWSASFGPRIWKEEKVIYHYHIWKVVENEGINKIFLFILLGYETERMKSRSANGLGLMHITKGAIESWKCYLPKIDEQQKIADCLSSIDDLITAQTQKLAALNAHKKGLMQQLFPAEGETVPELRFPEFRDGGEWEEIPLENYFGNIRNGFVGTATPYYVSNGIPYLQGKNIKQSRIDPTGLVNISSSFHQAQKKSQLRIGDILMVQSGHVGECALVEQQYSDSNCHALIVLSPNVNVHSAFFVQYFYSPLGRSQIAEITTGNTIKHILASDIRSLNVCVPSSEEQQKIADCLSSIDKLITTQSQKIEALKSHKKGLMQQIFPSMDEVDG